MKLAFRDKRENPGHDTVNQVVVWIEELFPTSRTLDGPHRMPISLVNASFSLVV